MDILKEMQNVRHFLEQAARKDITEQERQQFIFSAKYHLQRPLICYVGFGVAIAEEVKAQAAAAKE